MLEGMTSIQGGYIKTKKLSATNGRAWFDLDMATFELGGTAGMTGNGSGDDAFIWGNSTYENRNTADTRISHNGKLFSNNAYISGEINASKGKIGEFIIENGSMRVGDAWTLNSSFAYISPEQTIYRTLFGDTENMRDIRFGQTVSSSTGTYGAVCYIINWEKDSFRDNIGLQLDVKNGAVNTALDILNGGIQVKGQRGFSGLIYNDKDIIVQDGIIVGYR